MWEWWNQLSGLNQAFYGAAFVFTAFFLWQLVMVIIGMGGAEDVTSHVDAMDHSAIDHTALSDAQESLMAFKLVSIRSVLAFLTLFFWSAALYLTNLGISVTLLVSVLWGLGGMLGVAGIFHLMMKLTETGNPRMGTAVGASANVYMNIPANGMGEIRVMVSGIMTNVKARSRTGQPLTAGTKVKVTKVLDANTVEVIAEEQS